MSDDSKKQRKTINFENIIYIHDDYEKTAHIIDHDIEDCIIPRSIN